MIQVVTAANELVAFTQGIVIIEVQQYPGVYDHILKCLEAGEDLTIITSLPIVSSWLGKLAARYPQGKFVFETIDPRRVLNQRWVIPIPANVSNEDILETGLLKLDIHSQPGQSFDDIVLSHFYGPVFAATTIPFTRIAQLLDAFDLEKWKKNGAVPLLARILRGRLDQWKQNARTYEQKQLVEMFAAGPFDLRRQLIQFRVLQSYPDLGEATLGDRYALFSALKLALQDLTIDPDLIAPILPHVEIQLNSVPTQSDQDLKALVDGVSGLVMVEFDAIEKQMRAHPEWISTQLIDRVESKFENLAQPISRRLAKLRGLIRPPKPAIPQLSWNVDDMLAWATEFYLPYQDWCSSQEQFDPELYAIGDRFSEWLVNNWTDIHSNSKRMVFNVLPNIAAELKTGDHINLILVVDNLSWSFSAMLRELFYEQGYYLTSSQPYLAMLPSETEVSKKCLLSGEVGYTRIDDKTYKAIIEKGWVPYFDNNAFRYLSDIGNLSKIDQLDASTYVVNYLPVDKALHQSANEIGMPHREHVQHLLSHLVEQSRDFGERHGIEGKIRIYVVSDHGSTRISASVRNDLDPNIFKSSGFEARSHRYVEVSNARFAALPENLKTDCFFLPANDFLNQSNVLCARRANRFVPTDENFYVHGGLLPEEVIVPFLAFEPVTLPIQELMLSLKKKEFRYRTETIELDIRNPNDTAAEGIQISVLNNSVEAEPAPVVALSGKMQTAVQIKARFKFGAAGEDQSTLRLRVRFHSRGEMHTFEVHQSIVMRKMVQEKHTGVFDE